MTKAITCCAVLLGVLLLLAAAAPARDAAAHEKTATTPTSVEVKSVTVKLLDLELVDQDGRRVRLKSDVVGDRLVVIDVIYTSCPVVCPILSSVFASLQESLGDRVGKDVVLLSISVDPTTDIPPRLKAYAERWKAGPGWRFVTGQKRNVDEVLKGLNAWAPDFTDHPSMILVGDGRHGRWRRFYGFPSPARVLAEVDSLAARRQATSAEPPARTGRVASEGRDR